MWTTFSEPWQSVRFEIDEAIEAPNRVLARQAAYFRGRDGIEGTARTNWVWTIREGAITKLAVFNERDEALEAAQSLDSNGVSQASQKILAAVHGSGQ